MVLGCVPVLQQSSAKNYMNVHLLRCRLCVHTDPTSSKSLIMQTEPVCGQLWCSMCISSAEYFVVGDMGSMCDPTLTSLSAEHVNSPLVFFLSTLWQIHSLALSLCSL